MKSKVKYIFQLTNTLKILDQILFIKAKWTNRAKNQKFKNDHSSFKFPPDYFLYETYKLDYKQYKEDGYVSAKEVYEWTKDYLPHNASVLEWGCGVARIVRHLKTISNSNFKIFACDINNEMIVWNKNNIDDVEFKTIEYEPPTDYVKNTFDLVYGLSVFTHIEGSKQKDWITEISRILKPKGIFLFTTHGTNYFDKLSDAQMSELNLNGFYTTTFGQKGHRMMTTYNDCKKFKELLENEFEVVEFFEGKNFKEKFGGQDLWIVKKK
ncbi:MAG: class I SAM-dependent methyltransferase [Sphingobacteriales bacterium]|nr:class I SAM-dependent methyltransferase [Sphingobacteriales bacterium]